MATEEEEEEEEGGGEEEQEQEEEEEESEQEKRNTDFSSLTMGFRTSLSCTTGSIAHGLFYYERTAELWVSEPFLVYY
eukprot:9030253-Pyramimonas_sp.AAC.1